MREHISESEFNELRFDPKMIAAAVGEKDNADVIKEEFRLRDIINKFVESLPEEMIADLHKWGGRYTVETFKARASMLFLELLQRSKYEISSPLAEKQKLDILVTETAKHTCKVLGFDYFEGTDPAPKAEGDIFVETVTKIYKVVDGKPIEINDPKEII